MRVEALSSCHPSCAFCAREFLAWYARRMGAMNRPPREGGPSFAEAAASSVGARRVGEVRS
jgi:hypothetical protein